MNFLATILHHSQLRHSNQENFLTIAGESASKTMVTVLAPMTKVAMMWNHHVSTWWYFLLVASKEKYGVMNVGFFKWWKAMLTQKHWSNVHFFQGKKHQRNPSASCLMSKKTCNSQLTKHLHRPRTIPEQELQLGQRSRSMISSPVASATPFSKSRHETNKILFWMSESWKEMNSWK